MKFLLPALALLAGCSGSDQFSFERREFDRESVTVRKVEYASLGALQAEARRRGLVVEESRDLQAFGFIDPLRPACEIHFVSPNTVHRPEWIGHETMHCFYGRWHS